MQLLDVRYIPDVNAKDRRGGFYDECGCVDSSMNDEIIDWNCAVYLDATSGRFSEDQFLDFLHSIRLSDNALECSQTMTSENYVSTQDEGKIWLRELFLFH